MLTTGLHPSGTMAAALGLFLILPGNAPAEFLERGGATWIETASEDSPDTEDEIEATGDYCEEHIPWYFEGRTELPTDADTTYWNSGQKTCSFEYYQDENTKLGEGGATSSMEYLETWVDDEPERITVEGSRQILFERLTIGESDPQPVEIVIEVNDDYLLKFAIEEATVVLLRAVIRPRMPPESLQGSDGGVGLSTYLIDEGGQVVAMTQTYFGPGAEELHEETPAELSAGTYEFYSDFYARFYQEDDNISIGRWLLEIDYQAELVVCDIKGTSEPDNLSGTADDEVICALAGNDVIDGGGGFDLIYAGDGDDTVTVGSVAVEVYGGPGADDISGGPGDDLLYGDGGNDDIDGRGGIDVIYLGDGDDTLMPAGLPLEGVTAYGGAGNDIIWGSDSGDELFGDAGHDEILAGDGEDLIHGGDGDDQLDGGAGDDEIYGEAGFDKINGGDGDDLIWGGDKKDVIHGDDGDDFIDGEDGDDVLSGDDDDDIIMGGNGRDTIEGGRGGDELYGDNANDTIDGGIGGDIIEGGQGHDTLYGGPNRDRIIGNGGNEILIDGGTGRDRIRSGPGDDYLDIADGEEDFANCGSGNDDASNADDIVDTLINCEVVP